MRRLAVIAAVFAVSAFAPAAPAQHPDGDRGRELLNAVEEGDRGCGDLDAEGFEAIGEYLMGRMAGGAGPHGAMDDAMRSMMGDQGEQAAHEQMGRRLAGCGRGALGGMMGMMMGGVGPGAGMMAGGDRPGIMGMPDGPPYASSSREVAGDDGDWHGEDTATVVLIALLLLLAGGALWGFRPLREAPRAETPLDVLARRFAAGEIDKDDYDRRRQALGGTG